MTLAKKPFFSIIVPCCDVEPYVEECLDSILKQSFQDWECIIGIETSKDKTENVIRELTANDDRFRIFTGPRSGSCSASRNTGTDMAQGEYIIFLDGDDTIAEEALQRLHDKIAARPGADLYPCAMLVHNETTGKDEPTRDNYPADFNGELTGPEASIMIGKRWFYPCPMLQLSVFRKEFLSANNLKCIQGLRNQDSEFSPRALFLAKQVIPLHEPIYNYRIRESSVQTSAKGKHYFYKDWTVIFKSLFAFHASVCRESGYDKRVSECWAQSWISVLQIKWFSRDFVKDVPRKIRLEALQNIFANGFDDFNLLLETASRARKIAGWWIKAFVKHPFLRPFAELFFIRIYFPLSNRGKDK